MKKIFLSLLGFCLDRLYDYLDKDKDGKLNKEEIGSIMKPINKFIYKIRKLKK